LIITACTSLSGRKLFFFASRRRHTSFSRDWSSDVCSSDLRRVLPHVFDVQKFDVFGVLPDQRRRVVPSHLSPENIELDKRLLGEIGRASCRERVKISAAPVTTA